jgi:hypothetical protein
VAPPRRPAVFESRSPTVSLPAPAKRGLQDCRIHLAQRRLDDARLPIATDAVPSSRRSRWHYGGPAAWKSEVVGTPA